MTRKQPTAPATLIQASLNRRAALALGLGAVSAIGLRPGHAATSPDRLRLLAPPAYADPALLKALAGKGPAIDLAALADDDGALLPLRPLPPTATAAQRGARPALVVTAHPWPRGVLWPEGVIEPMGKDGSTPATPIDLFPGIEPTTATLESGIEERYVLGRATRFDLATLAVDRRRVSIDAVDDLGIEILNDPALNGRYGLLADPRTLLPTAMLYAGLDPFRLQLPSERRRLGSALQQLVAGAGMISASANELAAALASGAIDIALPFGLGHIAAARLGGHADLVLAPPPHGPMAGKAAFYWVEIMAASTQSKPIAAARAVLDRLGTQPVVSAMARAGGGLCPVLGLLDPVNAGAITPDEYQALSLGDLPALLPLAAPMGLVPERHQFQPVLDQLLAPLLKAR